MKQRSVGSDPREGDALRWQGWKVTVLRREGDSVTYRAAHKDGRTKPDATVAIADWKQRAKGAQVAERASSSTECLVTGWVAGPCMVDGVPIQGAAHVVDLVISCAAHCSVHGGAHA